jgi:hypothetical protein
MEMRRWSVPICVGVSAENARLTQRTVVLSAEVVATSAPLGCHRIDVIGAVCMLRSSRRSSRPSWTSQIRMVLHPPIEYGNAQVSECIPPGTYTAGAECGMQARWLLTKVSEGGEGGEGGSDVPRMTAEWTWVVHTTRKCSKGECNQQTDRPRLRCPVRPCTRTAGRVGLDVHAAVQCRKTLIPQHQHAGAEQERERARTRERERTPTHRHRHCKAAPTYPTRPKQSLSRLGGNRSRTLSICDP